MDLRNVFLTLAAVSTLGAAEEFITTKSSADSIPRVNGGQQGLPRMDVVDVSSNNGYLSSNDFQIMKNNGVKGIIVKLTEGTYYRNPYAGSQISNARSVGLTVSAYHYSTYTDQNSARSEANYFADYASQLGFSGSTLMVNDLEDGVTKNGGVSGSSWAFNDQLRNRGYWNGGVYTYTSYKNQTNLDTRYVGDGRVWMASYPYYPSSNDLWNTQYGMWQWSSNAGFWGVNGTFDVSIDYSGMATTSNYVQKQIDGKWYLVDASTGQKQYGRQYIADQNKWVLYDRTTGAMLYGQQYDQGHWYYFDPQTGAMQYGRQYLSDQNKWVLYDRNSGVMLYGQQYDQGHWYNFDSSSGAMLYGWQSLPQGSVYYDVNDGTMQYGLQNIDGTSYLLDSNTGAKMPEGQQNVDNKWYYVNADGSVQKGWKALPQGSVYYGDDGAMEYGLQTIDNKLYLLDPNTGAKMPQGEQNYNNKWYYVNSDGSVQKGWQVLSQGNVYYGDDGAMIYGRQNIQGKWYLLDRRTGAVQFGQQYDQGNWYYFDPKTGTMQYGKQYLADQKKTVYYDSAYGTMLYGRQYIDGSWYLLNRSTGAVQFGQQYDQGNWYYFDPNSGAMQYGKQYLSDQQKTVYYDTAYGTMKYGQQNIDGYWYLFDTWSGAMQFGRQYIADQNKWVLYDRLSGKMLYGQQYDQGNWYLFDKNTGAMLYGNQFNSDTKQWDYYDAWLGIKK